MRRLVLLGALLSVLAFDGALAADKPFTDAAAYCQAVGNAGPDARYTGPAVPN